MQREVAAKASKHTDDEFWRDEWFPMFAAPPVVCDCSVPRGEPTPVRCVDYHGDPEGAYFRGEAPARSLGELVRWWIETIDSGGWTYVPRYQAWERDDERCDAWRLRAGLL